MLRIISLGTIACLVSVLTTTKTCCAVTFLTNPGVYTATPSSTFSDFPGQVVENLFDTNTESLWAIDSYAGNNPQGRDEGWITVSLDQAYLSSHLRFAPRKATGDTDSVNSVSIWLSHSPLSVDVTSAASTTAFLLSAKGAAPNITLGPFANFIETDYALPSTVTAKYVVARFLNTSDRDNDRNLGGRTFLIGHVGIVPEPSTLALFASVALMILPFQRRKANES